MIKKIAVGALVILAFALGILLTRSFYAKKTTQVTNTDSTVLLERVRKVCKLVTVEGEFSELYDETNIRQFTFYLPLPSTFEFSKKAILRVHGKVLVGYDLEHIKIKADSTTQTITLSNLPEPEILSVDHEVSYENLSESWFNSFSADDYTQLNKNAKEVLRRKAEEGKLLEDARLQGDQLIEAIRFMVESSGWKLRMEGDLLDDISKELIN